MLAKRHELVSLIAIGDVSYMFVASAESLTVVLGILSHDEVILLILTLAVDCDLKQCLLASEFGSG